MRTAQDEVLNLRVPASLRRDLDGAAQANGMRLSVVARNALIVGLAAIRGTHSPDDPPPPAAPAVQVQVAA